LINSSGCLFLLLPFFSFFVSLFSHRDREGKEAFSKCFEGC
jgi:hypothetical protein